MKRIMSITQNFLNRAEFIEAGDYALITTSAKDTDFIITLALAERFCIAGRADLEKAYLDNFYASWLCLYKEDLIGVAIIHKVKAGVLGEIFTFDAFEIPTKNKSSSVEFGKLILNWADKKDIKPLWTAHDIRNRAATIVCLRLGFKTITQLQGKIVMRRDNGN